MRKDLRAYDEALKKENKTGEFEFFEKEFANELNLWKIKISTWDKVCSLLRHFIFTRSHQAFYRNK